MGDIHWVCLKLRDWLKRRGHLTAEVHIWNMDGRPRSIEFIDRVHWLKRGGYFEAPADEEFKRLYMLEHRTDSVYNHLGFDAVIGTNGNMRNGVPFYKIMEGAE